MFKPIATSFAGPSHSFAGLSHSFTDYVQGDQHAAE
jgi:hypothetical protein